LLTGRVIMVTSFVVRTVDFCVRRCWLVIVAGTFLMLVAAADDVARFSITTDVEALISQKLTWHYRQNAFSAAFPQKGITAVVKAPTPENVERATNALVQNIAKRPNLFRTVEQADSGDFFERDGLLFEPLAEVNKTIGGLKTAQPLISGLAGDPTLRGIMRTLSFAAQGVEVGELKLDQLHWPLSLAEKTLNNVLAGKAATFSWQELVQGRPLQAAQLRHFVEIEPILNFSALQPGAEATAAIRQAAVDLNLMGDYGAKVDLTGRVPLNDDQFSVLQQSTVRDTLTALIGVLIVLWLALRSWKIIASVFLSLIVGLTVTTALGLVMVGAFNLISIAFFVLFVGLGVDFGIQFSVRYRSERHERNDLHAALRSAARKIATPLALAAAATAVAFFSFCERTTADFRNSAW